MAGGGESVLNSLWKRQVVSCCHINAQISCKILRRVILQPRSQFTPVWSKESQKHICIGMDRRMYYDNHHSCYYNDGPGGEPCLRYKLDPCVFKTCPAFKIVGVLLYHCHILDSPKFPEEKTTCFLVLTADGYLKVLDADTGSILRSVFLSTAISFRYLQWAQYLKTVQIKSTQTTKPPPAVGPSPAHSRLMTIAVFRIHPLELVLCMHIDRKIFGHNITDAFINEDLLVVKHRGGTLKIYSLAWIQQHYTTVQAPLGEFVELRREESQSMRIQAGAVGNPDFGIPCTVEITECPPLLFSTKTHNGSGISFGGHPTLYLGSSPATENEFLLKTLKRQELVSVLKAETMAFHSDVAEFHFDDFRKILHISGCTLSSYRLAYDGSKEKHTIHREYKIDFRDQISIESLPLHSSSGRRIRRRYPSLDVTDLYTSAVQDVDYENETDLLYAVVTLPDPTSEANMQSNLYFINEDNGTVLKKVPLPTWVPDGNNSIYCELDCILHLLQTPSSSTCHYYRLTSS